MTKYFCVVDPDLKHNNPIGHAIAYDKALCSAARKVGFNAIILGRTTLKLNEAFDISARAVLTQGLWELDPEDRIHKPFLSDLMSFMSLLAISPNFDRVEVSKIDVISAAISLLVRFWDKITPYLFYLKNNKNKRPYFRAGLRFFKELMCGLKEIPFNKNSYILAQQVSGPDLFGWALFALYCEINSGPRIGIILRYEHHHYKEFRAAFELLEPFTRNNRVTYFSDSSRLVRDYSRFTKSIITLIPIPHAEDASSAIDTNLSVTSREIVFGSLGGARLDKGFKEICDAIKILEEKKQSKGIKFILHAHNPDHPSIKNALLNLESQRLSYVTIVEKTLEPNDYFELLTKQDVILLPYYKELYPSRTSGVLAEAMCAGKVCIVTANTWLSDQLTEYGSGVICQSESGEDLARAIIEVKENFEELSKIAKSKSESARQWHNPEKTIDILLRPALTPDTH